MRNICRVVPSIQCTWEIGTVLFLLCYFKASLRICVSIQYLLNVLLSEKSNTFVFSINYDISIFSELKYTKLDANLDELIFSMRKCKKKIIFFWLSVFLLQTEKFPLIFLVNLITMMIRVFKIVIFVISYHVSKLMIDDKEKHFFYCYDNIYHFHCFH